MKTKKKKKQKQKQTKNQYEKGCLLKSYEINFYMDTMKDVFVTFMLVR